MSQSLVTANFRVAELAVSIDQSKASKNNIGSFDDPPHLPELDALKVRCLEESKAAFARAQELGFEVAREIRLAPAFANYEERPEFQLILAWLDEQ